MLLLVSIVSYFGIVFYVVHILHFDFRSSDWFSFTQLVNIWIISSLWLLRKTVSTGIQIFVWTCFHFFREVVALYVGVWLFKKKKLPRLFSKEAVLFYWQQQCMRGLVVALPCQHWVWLVFLVLAILVQCYCSENSVCISLMTDAEHLFRCLFAFHKSSWVGYMFTSPFLPPF